MVYMAPRVLLANILLLCQMQPYLKPGDGPIVLVLAPTRELAVQIKEECDKFGASSEIKNTVVYGGVPKHRQVRDLRSGMEIVIATPVRLFVSCCYISYFCAPSNMSFPSRADSLTILSKETPT